MVVYIHLCFQLTADLQPIFLVLGYPQMAVHFIRILVKLLQFSYSQLFGRSYFGRINYEEDKAQYQQLVSWTKYSTHLDDTTTGDPHQ